MAGRRGPQSTRKGIYTPKHPDKYVGDATSIRYMSSWELSVHQFFDRNPNVLRWSSEEIAIPYVKPTDGRVHRYFPDYWIEYRDKQGNLKQEIIEVKPDAQTRSPTRKGKARRTQIYEQLTYTVNIAKWRSATLFCKERGIVFRILTEKQLFR